MEALREHDYLEMKSDREIYLQVVELLACNKVGIGLFTLVIRHILRKIVNISVLNLLA